MGIDPLLPDDRRRRYDLLHGGAPIGLPFDSLRADHHFGGQMPDIHYICKLPGNISELAALGGDSSSARLAAMLQGLPEFCKVHDEVKKQSRPKAHAQMARALANRWSLVTKLSPAVARGILRDVAGYDILGYDRPAAKAREKRRRLVNTDADSIDTRLEALLDTGDPGIILDGRSLPRDLSEGSGQFDAFWSAVEQVITSSDAAVVDDRRHNQSSGDTSNVVVLRRSSNVSFRDIHQRAARLVGENDAIPSLRWMEYQFWPKDSSLRSAVNYTGRFKVSMGAQSAQLRKSHPDQLIGHVEFKYLKTLAVRKRHLTDMICGDDKHKVNA